MARKQKQLKTINITGMTIKDVVSIGGNIRDYDLKSIKTITSRLVSATNKRIRRLGASERGKMSPTYKAYQKQGKFYSIKGLNKNSLISLYYELAEKSGKITNLKDWKKYQDSLYKELGIDFIDPKTKKWDIDLEKDFWDMYNKYLEFDKEYATSLKGKSNRKTISNSVIEYIKNSIDWQHMTFEDMKAQIKELYEQSKTYDTESSFFENGDEEYEEYQNRF